MNHTELHDAVLQLPPQERLKLVEVLWRSLDYESLPVKEWQARILEERIKADEEAPDESSSWEEVKLRLQHRLGEHEASSS